MYNVQNLNKHGNPKKKKKSSPNQASTSKNIVKNEVKKLEEIKGYICTRV